MLRIENLKLSPGGGPSALRNAVLHILRIPEKDLLALHILRRSIDAREGVRMVYTVEVEAADEAAVLRRCRDKHVSKAAPRPVYQLPEPVTPPEEPPVANATIRVTRNARQYPKERSAFFALSFTCAVVQLYIKTPPFVSLYNIAEFFASSTNKKSLDKVEALLLW